jgi:hypothetical protein
LVGLIKEAKAFKERNVAVTEQESEILQNKVQVLANAVRNMVFWDTIFFSEYLLPIF